MDVSQITPVILTLNEECNIGRCLARLRWASHIIVCDSCSDDETVAIARTFPNVSVIQQRFDTHASQWNHAIAQSKTAMVLTLDADYVCPKSLVEELLQLAPPRAPVWVRFRYAVHGHVIRGSLYPPRPILFDRTKCVYVQDGHTQRLEEAGGPRAYLKSVIVHDDRKPLSRWLSAQTKYAALESEKLIASSAYLRLQDRVRRIPLAAPFLVGCFVGLARGAIFQGRPGRHYLLQRIYAEVLLSLALLDQTLRRRCTSMKDNNDAESLR